MNALKLNYRSWKLPQSKLKAARRSKDVTLKEVAELFGVTETTIRNIEAGRVSASEEFMVGMSNLLGADIFALFPDSPLLKHVQENYNVSKV